MQVTYAAAAPPDVDLIGIPVATGAEVLVADAGITHDQLVARGFEGKVGETAIFDRAIAVGVGDRSAITPEVMRRASAALVKSASKRTTVASLLLAAVTDDALRPAAAQAAAEGSLLATYRFTRYKRDPAAPTLTGLTIVAKGGKRVGAAVERGVVVAAAVRLARDLVNTPSRDLTPIGLAAAATEAGGAAGLTVEVIDEKQAAKLGLGGLLDVGKGSENPPRMVKLTYDPPGARATLAWVGKGITFDSGGLSLKTGDGMMTMKHDMAGAAAVLGAMTALPALAAKVRVIGFLCAAENMPSGHAIRPGDVLKTRNGTTVEVLNTDAEGRLVLADGLALAAEEKPDGIVDLATLTGAVRAALGTRMAGLMGNDDALLEQVRDAADRSGEPVWPLPLPADYRRMLDSDVADLKNVSRGGPGALIAGLFLQEFVDGVPWAHLDIAGPAFAEDEPDALTQKGGTGWGVRTLLALAESYRRPAKKR